MKVQLHIKQCIVSPQKKEYNEAMVVAKLVRHFSNFNKDYSDFLSLKGEVNIPMVRYPF